MITRKLAFGLQQDLIERLGDVSEDVTVLVRSDLSFTFELVGSKIKHVFSVLDYNHEAPLESLVSVGTSITESKSERTCEAFCKMLESWICVNKIADREKAAVQLAAERRRALR